MGNNFKIDIPKDSEHARLVMDHTIKEKQIEIGLLGKVFGNTKMTPVYVAGLVAILALIGGFVFLVCSSDKAVGADIFKMIIAVVSGALGFIFGASTAK